MTECLLHVACISSAWFCKHRCAVFTFHCMCLSYASVSPVPQPPTITLQSPKDYIFDPRENIVIHCEAKGKPHPRWDNHSSHPTNACLSEHVQHTTQAYFTGYFSG